MLSVSRFPPDGECRYIARLSCGRIAFLRAPWPARCPSEESKKVRSVASRERESIVCSWKTSVVLSYAKLRIEAIFNGWAPWHGPVRLKKLQESVKGNPSVFLPGVCIVLSTLISVDRVIDCTRQGDHHGRNFPPAVMFNSDGASCRAWVTQLYESLSRGVRLCRVKRRGLEGSIFVGQSVA